MSGPVAPVLAACALAVRAGRRELVTDLSVELRAGEFTAILGRNGSGKTLLLSTLAGLRPAHAGRVRLGGAPLESMRRRAVARRLGVLPQDAEEGFAASVLESVLIGRHPHIDPWRWETAEDERIAHRALEHVGLEGFAARALATLSGGESRRVAIASLLAQDPQIFVLDEPTNHLDPQHQLGVLSLFAELARNGRTVLATLHDPTLAARFADRAILLFGDGRWRCGPAGEVLTAPLLSELYRTPVAEASVQGRRVFVNV